MKKRMTCLALIMIMCASMCFPAFAADLIDESAPEEIIIPIHNNAEVRKIEVATHGITNVDVGDYTYEVEIIGRGTKTIPKDVTDYVSNRNYVSEGTCPTVQYSRGESTTISGSIEVASELMIPVIKAKVSASAGVDHEAVNTQTITYAIPYGYKGCICFSCGIIGINILTAASLTRDLYLNGTYMKAIDVMERTGTVLLLKIDITLVVIGIVLLLLTIVIKGAKK